MRGLVHLAVLSVFLAVLVGCGAPGPRMSPRTPEADQVARDKAGVSPERIVIGVRDANDHAPFFIAEQQNLYEQHGVDVAVRIVPNNTEIVEGLQRGEFQVGVVPATTALAAIARGSPMRIVAMTGRGSDGLLVRQDEAISGIADLRGKRVATIRASILDVLLRHTLQEAGLDPDRDVELIYMNGLGDMISALRTGQVDATSNTEPFLTEAEMTGWGRILLYYTEFWPNHPCCVVLARDDLAKERPEVLEGILATHVETITWANAHLDEAADIICAYVPGLTPGLVRESLDGSRMLIDYRIDPEEMARMAGLMAAQGLIEEEQLGVAWVDLEPLRRALEGQP